MYVASRIGAPQRLRFAQLRSERNAFGPLAHWQDGKAAADHCSCTPAEGDGEEKTYTDNISPRENDSPAIQGIPLLFGWDLAKMRGEGANKPR